MIDSVSGSRASDKMGAVKRDGNDHGDLFRENKLGLDRACAIDAVNTNEAGHATAAARAGTSRVKAGPIAAIAASAAIAEAEAVAALLTTASSTTKTAEAFVVASSCCSVVGATSSKRVELAMVSLHSNHCNDGNDDLMLFLHPDELISPMIVSVQCP